MTTRNMNIVTPIARRTGRQLWAMAFMATGLLVCTPALPELHEQAPIGVQKAANHNATLSVVRCQYSPTSKCI